MLKSFVIILIGSVMAIWTAKDAIDDGKFERYGKTAVVEPLEKYTEITKKKGGQTTVNYEADFKFRTESGQPVTVKRHLPVEMLQKFSAGKPVLIYYLPDNPRNVRLDQQTGRMGGGVGIGFWVLIMLAGVFWFRRKWQSL